MNTAELSSKYSLIKKASSNMFVSVAIASFVVAFSLVTIKFLWDLRGFNSAVESAQSETIDTLKANINNFSQLSEDFVVFEGDEKSTIIGDQGDRDNTTTVLDALPSKYDFPAIGTAVQNLATRAGVTLTGFDGVDNEENALTSSPDPIAEEIPFTVSIEGSYKKVKAFIYLSNKSIRPYYIDTIQMAGSDDLLRVTLQMRTFYQPAINVDEIIKQEVTQ